MGGREVRFDLINSIPTGETAAYSILCRNGTESGQRLDSGARPVSMQVLEACTYGHASSPSLVRGSILRVAMNSLSISNSAFMQEVMATLLGFPTRWLDLPASNSSLVVLHLLYASFDLHMCRRFGWIGVPAS